jgi:hypothetical protein
MRVPGFLIRRFYVQGSLRNTEGGFALEARNEMGDGMLVGVRRIAIDGVAYDPERITAIRSDGTSISAAGISRQQPVPIRRGDRVALHVAGEALAPGEHLLEVDIVERDLGGLELSLREVVQDEGGEPEPPPAG